MQEGSECLEVTHSHPNFTLGNQFKGIMKKNADAGNIDNRRNPHRRGSSSKNAEIENYLSTTSSDTILYWAEPNIVVRVIIVL